MLYLLWKIAVMLTFEKFCKANKAHTALQADDLLKSSKVGDAFVFDAIGYKENCTVRTHVEAFLSHSPSVTHTHTRTHTLSAIVFDAIDWLQGTLHGTHSCRNFRFTQSPSPYIHTHAHTLVCVCFWPMVTREIARYGVALINRLFKITGLFCRI